MTHFVTFAHVETEEIADCSICGLSTLLMTLGHTSAGWFLGLVTGIRVFLYGTVRQYVDNMHEVNGYTEEDN